MSFHYTVTRNGGLTAEDRHQAYNVNTSQFQKKRGLIKRSEQRRGAEHSPGEEDLYLSCISEHAAERGHD